MASTSKFSEADFQLAHEKSGIPMWLLKSADFPDANFQGLLDRARAGEPALTTPTGKIASGVAEKLKHSPSEVFVKTFVSGVKDDLSVAGSMTMKVLKYGAIGLGALAIMQVAGLFRGMFKK